MEAAGQLRAAMVMCGSPFVVWLGGALVGVEGAGGEGGGGEQEQREEAGAASAFGAASSRKSSQENAGPWHGAKRPPNCLFVPFCRTFSSSGISSRDQVRT